MRGKTFIPHDYDVFAGLDVDKRSISVTLPITKDSSARCAFVRHVGRYPTGRYAGLACSGASVVDRRKHQPQSES